MRNIEIFNTKYFIIDYYDNIFEVFKKYILIRIYCMHQKKKIILRQHIFVALTFFFTVTTKNCYHNKKNSC